MVSREPPTEFPELNHLLAELTERVDRVLGDDRVGVYLQGSFAVGDADLASDCDFLVPIRRQATAEQEQGLRALHDELPTRDGFWNRHLEGSYPVASELRTLDGLGREWLYIDHGWREMQWATHCNNVVSRWSLRERGVVLAGPDPTTLVDPVPPEQMRAYARASAATFWSDFHSWMTLDIGWGQRYAVTTYCRFLATLDTAEVLSKRAALDLGTGAPRPAVARAAPAGAGRPSGVRRRRAVAPRQCRADPGVRGVLRGAVGRRWNGDHMSQTWTAMLVDQLDFYLAAHLMPRLEGLTDEEYFWEPVPDCWSVRPDGSRWLDLRRGRARRRERRHDDRVAARPRRRSSNLGTRANGFFGPMAGDDADMFDSRYVDPVPGRQRGDLPQLTDASTRWRDGIAGLDDEALAVPVGPKGGPFADDPLGALVLHVSRETMHHGGEIGVLRDLYRDGFTAPRRGTASSPVRAAS